MKFLVYEDEDGKTWISYREPSLLAKKYKFGACLPVLEKMDAALAKFSNLGAQ